MADIINIRIAVGNSSSSVKTCPTVVTSATPIISWELPDGIDQKRFNIKIKSLEPEQNGLFILGEQISRDTIFQYPVGNPMTNQFIGLLSVEIAVSENGTSGQSFEYSSGEKYFVYDTVAEQFYNASEVTLEWSNSTDVNVGQTLTYNLIVSKDPLFQNNDDELLNSFVPQNSGGTRTSFNVTVESNTTYFWKVRAYDGIDYGYFSRTNGFINTENFAPVVTITNVLVTGNEYADVYITFTLEDIDNEYCYIEAVYTGGNAKEEEVTMSLLNPLGKVTNGEHTVVWRSGRNEQLIYAEDYFIYLTPYDTVTNGGTAVYGPITLDNRSIGADNGGIGSPTIDFPLTCMFAKMFEGEIEDTYICLQGRIEDYKKAFKEVMEVQTFLSTWCIYAQAAVSDMHTAKYITNDSHEDCVFGDFGYKYEAYHNHDNDFVAFPQGFNGFTINKTGYGVGGITASHGSPDNAPPYILTEDYVDENGNYIAIKEDVFNRLQAREGLMRFYKVRLMDKQFCQTCGGKGWNQEELIEKDGKYYRTPCSECNGTRFSDISLGHLAYYLEAYYEPIEKWITPYLYRDAKAFCSIQTPKMATDTNFKWGYPHNRDAAESFYQRDCLSINNKLYNMDGTYEALHTEAYMALKVYDDMASEFVPVSGMVLGPAEPSTVTIPVVSSIREGQIDYKTGYDEDEAPGFVGRGHTLHRWEHGIYPISCNIADTKPLEPLKIIYLQSGWDTYNTIHWQSTMSSTTRMHLQVTKFFEDGTHTEYTDVIAEDSEYIASAGAYMTPPMKWHLYWDVVRTQFLEEGYDYRLRIRQFDVLSNTASQWIYSSKFAIRRNVSNPPNIMSMEYDRWTKILKIVFRLDDTRNFAYDITRVWYSADGHNFKVINTPDIEGNKTGLLSDRIKLPSGQYANEHTIYWKTQAYNLHPGNNYRIRIEVVPSIITQQMDIPVFKWYKALNPALSEAELNIKMLNGQVTKYSFDPDTGESIELDNPIMQPGKITTLQAELDDMRHTPPPSGMYEFFDPSGVLIDPSGYREWYSVEMAPGISRGQIIAEKQEELNQLINVELPKWTHIRNEAERRTRKYLIDQGFYCNGFVNNNPSSGIFRFRVESNIVGSDDYHVVYETDFENYEVIQMDFFSSFDSQNGLPLREFLYDVGGERISGLPMYGGTILTPTGEKQLNVNPVDDVWSDFGNDESSPWYGQPNAEQGLAQTTTFDGSVNKLHGEYTIPHEELPGERSDYYIDNTYPDVTDTLPEGIGSFDTSYFWRVASYNLVHGQAHEIPRPVYSLSLDGRALRVNFLMRGDRYIQTGSLHFFDYNHRHTTYHNIPDITFSLDDGGRVWTNHELLQFPTDRPAGYEAQSDDNPVPWIPYGLNRSRPCVIIKDHNYMIWYSKAEASFGADTIMHSRGKAYKIHAEYSLAFPDNQDISLFEYNGMNAMFSPSVINDAGLWKMWVVGFDGTSYGVFVSSSVDADTWAKPTHIQGLSGNIYSVHMTKDSDTYKLFYSKMYNGKVHLFCATSMDGESFAEPLNPLFMTQDNLGAPSVVEFAGDTILFYTKYESGTSHIYSRTLNKTGEWVNEKPEIIIDDTLNPYVITDVYNGDTVLRMYYNKQEGTEYKLYTAILDYSSGWNHVSLYSGSYLSGHFNNMKSSVDGYEYLMVIDLNNSSVHSDLKNITSVDNLHLRFNVHSDVPSRYFMRMSDWVTYENASEWEAELIPDGKYKYNSVMKDMDYGTV